MNCFDCLFGVRFAIVGFVVVLELDLRCLYLYFYLVRFELWCVGLYLRDLFMFC